MASMHIVEVDQSGKFEATKADTVLAFSNGITFSLLIHATTKRDCIRLLRRTITSGPTLYTQVFATCLFLLLRHHIERLEEVIIDQEYRGKEAQIKEHLLHLLRRAGYQVRSDQISFEFIGKVSNAHRVALTTWRRDLNPSLVVTLKDILSQFKT